MLKDPGSAEQDNGSLSKGCRWEEISPVHLGLAPSSAHAPLRDLLPALAVGKQLA